MELGKYYYHNRKKTDRLTDSDWKIALAKCKEHIRWKLRQKTLSGAHSAANLGTDPVDHYLGIAFEKILAGDWEWKDDYTLGQQMIRIVDSSISKSVEKVKTDKYEALQVKYVDVEQEFYDLAEPPSEDDNGEFEQKLKSVEEAVVGDIELEIMIEAIKEGKKRSEIAQILDLSVRQFDKLREKLIRRVLRQTSNRT